MTIEQLLVLFFFLLIPLVDFLVRAWRERQAGGAEPPGVPAPARRVPGARPRPPGGQQGADGDWREPDAKAAQGAPPPPSIRPSQSLPSRRPGPQRAGALADARDRAAALRPQRTESIARAPVTPSPPAPPWGRRRRVSGPLGSVHDLRRAIVLMTILGPCRALDRHPPTPI